VIAMLLRVRSPRGRPLLLVQAFLPLRVFYIRGRGFGWSRSRGWPIYVKFGDWRRYATYQPH
jgi:hypothetical protein